MGSFGKKFGGGNGQKDLMGDEPNGYPGGYGGVESALGQGIMPDGYGEDSDDSSEGEDDDEREEFSVAEQVENENGETAKGKNYLFGLERKHKKSAAGAEDDLGILEGDDDFQDGDDFVNYAFEEPPELKVKSDGDSCFGDWNGANAWGAAAADIQGANEIVLEKGLGNDEKDEDDVDSESGSDSWESGSERSGSKKSAVGGVGDAGHLGGLVDNGNWEGVMETAAKLDSNLNEESETSNHSDLKSHATAESGSSHHGPEAIDDIIREVMAEEEAESSDPAALSAEEIERREQYREQVLELVKKAAPNEIDSVETMLEQFEGREAELISTLQTMYARSNSQKRLKAVHRSRKILHRGNSSIGAGGAEGSAVIAAASMMYGEEDPDDSFVSGSGSYDEDDEKADGDDQGSYTGSYDSREGSYTGSYRSGEGSYRSGEGSYTGSYNSQEGSYTGSYTGSHSGSRSYSEGSYTGTYNESAHDDHDREGGSYTGSYTGSRSGSYSQEGSHTGTHNDEGTFDDKDRSRSGGSGSYYSQEGSFTGSHTGSRSGSRSYVSGHGSFVSGKGSYTGNGSYNSQEGSNTGSYRSGSGRHSQGSYTESNLEDTMHESQASYYYEEG